MTNLNSESEKADVKLFFSSSKYEYKHTAKAQQQRIQADTEQSIFDIEMTQSVK